ncbi:MAG: ABC transporter permease [Proteobacteria bacterium]|jgi:peptide/nickel transport system permease protein|nr:ABC transporter permease [Pseudomonadota bacterium]NBS59088.1 ABC transporter permease [Betaproteobacteria bacterium]
MFFYFLKRLGLVIPIAISVTVVCFSLVYLAPGDPLSAILPSDASIELIEKLKKEYGLDKPIPVQYVIWLGKALIGDLGTSIATGRPVSSEIGRAISNTLVLAFFGSAIGFSLGLAFGTIAGYKQGSWIDKTVTGIAVAGVSVPHYWLGMVLVIIFSVILGWLPAMGAGPSGEWAWDLEHIKHVLLPAITISVIPTAIVTRTVRALVADILGREFVTALRAKGLTDRGVFIHVVKNAAPTSLAVMGVQLGYLMGGSILVETVFSWPGTGFLLNTAIFQRDIPLLQGTILVLALFFVGLNLVVDLIQTALDPRIKRA